MSCPQCGNALPEGVTLCPECGAPAAGPRSNHTREPLESEISTFLAEANLLRLRRSYELATAKCIEVLRKYPNNASAHSLLGDIYRDQGSHSDALEWYELAIQLDPASVADREKIQQIHSRLRVRQQEQAADTPAWRRAYRRARARVPFGLVLGLVLGCILLGALIALSVGRSQSTASITSPGPRIVLPATPTRSAAPALPPRRETRPPRTQAEEPGPGEQGTMISMGRQATAPPSTLPADKEQALSESLRAAAQTEELRVKVDDVQVDPRDGGATVRVGVQDAVATPEARGLVLEKSLRLAELALAHDPTLTRLTMRCSAPVQKANGLQREEVVMVGDVSPEALRAAAGHTLTFDQALRLFATLWWHPCMAPAR